MSKLSIDSDVTSQTIILFTELQGVESLTNGVKFTLKNGSEIIVKGTNPDNDYVKVAHSIQSDWLKHKPTGIYSCKEKVNGKEVISVDYDYEAFI
jgi:hypothetical protein